MNIKKHIYFTADEEMVLKGISIEQNISVDIAKNIISEYVANAKKIINAPRYVMLPISTAHKNPMGRAVFEVENELIDITQFCRVKPFKEKADAINRGKKVGCLLCSEPTGKFATLIVDGLSVEEVAELYKQSGVHIVVENRKRR